MADIITRKERAAIAAYAGDVQRIAPGVFQGDVATSFAGQISASYAARKSAARTARRLRDAEARRGEIGGPMTAADAVRILEGSDG